ncbi:MAG: N-acetylglucosamine-6-phosphate deacetylase [Clostridia bacterium]|nr:N-acetylglucosamine-6-phosphate deacetylase [Clostridia bacterium]
MKGLKSVKAYIYGEGIKTVDIGFDGDKIAVVGNGLDVEPICDIPTGATVVAGFIDEHIHGAAGADAMDGSLSALKTISDCLVKEGTTGFLATTMTQSRENIKGALSAIKCAVDNREFTGARVLGAHLEGPFISVKHVGAQPLEFVEKPSVERFKEYNEAAGGNIRIVSLAPEVEGGAELVKYLADKGVVASIGHTDAKYNDVVSALNNGAKNITHTFNAQTGVHHREIGVAGSALLLDELNCEMICDTIHVSVPAIKLALKNKPKNKFTLITDSMRAKGLPDGESELGGQKVFVKNGEARLADGTLAGSVLKMNVAVKNIVEKCGVSFTDAIDCATVNPAENIGVSDKYGSIAKGKFADFTVLDEEFNVLLTIVGGKVVYRA